MSIVTYDPAWQAQFAALAQAVREAVGEDVVRLEHIGSTSVPGLAAKPVIDIQASVRDLAAADRWPERIGPFARRAHVVEDHVPPGAHRGPGWAKRYWSAAGGAHLHVRVAGAANERYALLFRDHLRADPDAATAYARAKVGLAALAPDPAAYAEAKDPVCDLVILAAERWARSVGWSPPPPAALLLQKSPNERSTGT